MKYVIITPVFNEADKIADLINSVTAQTIVPSEWVIVDDGSTDNTVDVIKSISVNYPWIRIVKHLKDSIHSSGSKIAKACIFGYENIYTSDFEIITKLDADLVLPKNYFAEIINEFRNDSSVGLCGGVCVIQDNGFTKIEKVADEDHVRGALKSYRKSTYESIGGIRPVEGWDTLDELLVKYHGQKVKVINNLQVLHKRETDAQTNLYKVPIKAGKSFYIIGYNFLIALTSSAKLAIRKPRFISFFLALYGYISCYFNSQEREVTKPERQFINAYRLKKIRQKMVFK